MRPLPAPTRPRRTVALSLTALLSWAGAWTMPLGPLPLGRPGLAETRRSEQVAPGVTLWQVRRGQPDPQAAWTLTVALVPDALTAAPILRELRRQGEAARLDRAPGGRPDGTPVGFLVRIGRYPTREAAAREAARLQAAGRSVGVQSTGEDGAEGSGPYRLDLIAIAPGAAGRLTAALAQDRLVGRETTSSLARRRGALAAINGGFFVQSASEGTEGDLIGLSVIGGELVSEAYPGRPALLLGGPAGPLAAQVLRDVRTELGVTASDGAGSRLGGLNRRASPRGELVAYRAIFGGPLPEVAGVRVTLDAAGTVLERRDTTGGELPPGTWALIGTGAGADWLRAHAAPGARLTLTERLNSAGQSIALSPEQSAVNGGPTLLDGGRITHDYGREGWTVNPKDGGLGYANFVTRRNPRSVVGITADGTVLLAVLDGRRPEDSVGASLEELARVLRRLGAVDAVNLDGGGSSALVVRGELVGRPSDPGGERPDGDAVLLLP